MVLVGILEGRWRAVLAETAEIIKTFGERCPHVRNNNIQAKADYIVVLDHEGGKGLLQHRTRLQSSNAFPVILCSANLLCRWVALYRTHAKPLSKTGQLTAMR